MWRESTQMVRRVCCREAASKDSVFVCSVSLSLHQRQMCCSASSSLLTADLYLNLEDQMRQTCWWTSFDAAPSCMHGRAAGRTCGTQTAGSRNLKAGNGSKLCSQYLEENPAKDEQQRTKVRARLPRAQVGASGSVSLLFWTSPLLRPVL